MKQRIIKLYRAAKRIVPVLTIILLLGQIPSAYIDLAHQVKGGHTRTK
jgi:uncharacterized membrane protein YfbV (UPF0208 family)